MENGTCQHCKKDFEITADDETFYEMMKVPKPTFCPDCRARRRFIWRNERSLHKRPCSSCKKDFISLYREDVPFPVFCHNCYHSDNWDPTEYALEYNPQENFFSQLKKLLDVVPRLGIWVVQSINSDYTNQSYNNKNSYLSYGFRDSEDCQYVARAVDIKNTFDSTYTHHSDHVYQCINVDKSYRSSFLDESDGIVESHYLASSRNTSRSMGGVNLRSASNYFFGEQLTKDTYDQRIKQIDLGSRKVRGDLEEKFRKIKSTSIVRSTNQVNCQDCVGDHLENAKNCFKVFDGFDLENARHSAWVFTSKDISDCFGMGGSQRIYESISPEEVQNCKFLFITDSSHDVEYGLFCQTSANLFGCVGLRSKEYCILNKEYSREEYKSLVEQIKRDMMENPYIDKQGTVYKYGEFFPSEFSAIPYNESTAQEYFPISKTEALKLGFNWVDEDKRSYTATKKYEEVPDNINDVSDSFTKEVISCSHSGQCPHQCTEAFRITSEELSFYREMKIPLPIICPNCRHFERMARRNPMKLWERNCAKCGNKMHSSYSPDRTEIVYCEDCYKKEIN